MVDKALSFSEVMHLVFQTLSLEEADAPTTQGHPGLYKCFHPPISITAGYHRMMVLVGGGGVGGCFLMYTSVLHDPVIQNNVISPNCLSLSSQA